MPTIEFDDQFVLEPAAPVRERYDTATILRRNVANLEIALKQQTDRAEAAEAELLAVREDNHSMMLEIDGMRTELAKLREQKPAVPAYLLERQENGLSWYIGATTRRGGSWHWTADVNSAIRFGREEDAAACWGIISRYHVGLGGSGTTETTPKQHIFEDASALLQSAEATK